MQFGGLFKNQEDGVVPFSLSGRLARCLEQIPDDKANSYAGLLFGKVWARFSSGKCVDVAGYLDSARAIAFDKDQKQLFGKIVYFTMMMLGQMEQFNKQIELMGKIRALLRPDSPEMAYNLMRYASALISSNKPGEAEKVWKDISAMSVLEKDEALRAHYNIMKGLTYYYPVGKLEKSLKAVERGVAYFKDDPQSNNFGLFSVYLTVVKEEMGLLNDNISIIKQAIKEMEGRNDNAAMLSLWIRAAINAAVTGDIGRAIEAINNSEKILVGTKACSGKIHNLRIAKALILFHQNRKNEFSGAAHEIINASERKDIWFDYYQAVCRLAPCLASIGQTEAALCVLKKSIVKSKELGNIYAEARSCFLIASILYDDGSVSECRAYLEKSLTLSESEKSVFLFVFKERVHSLKLMPFALGENIRPNFVKQILVNLGDDCVDKVMRLLSHGSPEARENAISILSDLQYKDANHELFKLLKDKAPNVRKEAIKAVNLFKSLPPAPIKVNMLGEFQLSIGKRLVKKSEWKRKAAKNIFKYFMFNHNKEISKEKLIETFYHDNDPYSGWKNVRQAISDLRKMLEPGIPSKGESAYIKYNNGFYNLFVPTGSYIDFVDFKNNYVKASLFMRKGKQYSSISFYNKAIALYCGDLLEENLYDDWTKTKRDEFRSMYITSLKEVSMHYFDLQEFELASENLIKLLDKNEFDENAYLLLMKCHIGLGERAEAVKVYKNCRLILQKEMSIQPCPELQKLYAAITAC